MGRAYVVPVQNALLTAATANALHRIVSGTAYRLRYFDLIIGARSTADAAAAFRLARESAFTSGGGAVTPNPVDSGDPVAVATASTGHSSAYTGLTAGAALLTFGLNQRGTYRYPVNPAFPFVFAAAANAGALLICDAISAAFNVDLSAYFEE
jgi:hypothetical protein